MGFEQFCIVELFGHQRIAGKVSEQLIGGQTFIRVDVPETPGQATFCKFYGAGAIYAITPVDEDTAVRAAHSFSAQPIELWRIDHPRLNAGDTDELPDEEEDWEEDAVSELEDIPF